MGNAKRMRLWRVIQHLKEATCVMDYAKAVAAHQAEYGDMPTVVAVALHEVWIARLANIRAESPPWLGSDDGPLTGMRNV